jgi:hypothetical protein
VFLASVAEIGLGILVYYLVTKELEKTHLKSEKEPILNGDSVAPIQNGSSAKHIEATQNSDTPTDTKPVSPEEQQGIKPHKPDLRGPLTAATRLAIMTKVPALEYIFCFSFYSNIYKIIA